MAGVRVSSGDEISFVKWELGHIILLNGDFKKSNALRSSCFPTVPEQTAFHDKTEMNPITNQISLSKLGTATCPVRSETLSSSHLSNMRRIPDEILDKHFPNVNQMHYSKKEKLKLSLTGCGGPDVSDMSNFPNFVDNRLRDGEPYASSALNPRKIPGTHFCYRLSQPQGHSAAGRIR
jgi:hypothetical protein